MLDRFAYAENQDFVAVAVIDDETNEPGTKRGNVPSRLLMPFDGGKQSVFGSLGIPMPEVPTEVVNVHNVPWWVSPFGE